MTDSERCCAVIGFVGVLCLAVYWAAMLFPQFANILPESSFGKFFVLGVVLASAPLTIIAAMRGSKRWWVGVAASAITLWDLYMRTGRVLA